MYKYECVTGEDLGYKPGVIEQAKFKYSETKNKEFWKGQKMLKTRMKNN